MTQNLKVKHTATRKGEPLVIIDNLFGSVEAELTPLQMRSLAATLLAIADDAALFSDTTRRHIPVRREYPLEG